MCSDAVGVDDYDPDTWLGERNRSIRKRSLPSAVTATQSGEDGWQHR